ncbi:uncharacterized protein Z518_09376 [Rhinocladiella mackenziei CBS 650.93]|uniref:Mucin n=1 Tax=Rhinocladiella mackenziei CBS 650.93 TaxID=1442369 RepID=A0A0D2IYH3_9EURO|nr:uncharacterized protein Z518_09376 [Rhinocladiella mackenziei CBS 650.93]KIX01650.1 hypothetical protein Z518_09376 [Rhinocladiella mackenziei CBS 650.93]
MRNSRRHSHTNEVAFESLPPALRRKYFSSLERLRLAQDGSNLSPPSRLSILSPGRIWTTTQSSGSFALLTNGLLFPGLLLSRTRFRSRRSCAANTQVTPSTVAWFASLPPTIQRKLFSREECSIYTGGRNIVILDAADETLRRRNRRPSQFTAFESHVSDDNTFVDWEDLKDQDQADPAVDMGDYSIEGFRWLEDEGDLDLKLDDYHEAIAETARRTASISEPVPAKRHARRNPSLSSISIRPRRSSTLSSRPQLDPPGTPALPPPKLHHSRSPSFSLKHIRSRASLSSIDPRATHYQDPAARMKLKLYLASPQKFDEAIEFGFPSVEERRQLNHTRPMTSPQPRPDVNRTFFHDDTPSLSGDEGDEPDEPDTLYDPRTPEDPVFQIHRPSHKISVDGNAGLRPVSVRRQPETYARGLATDREMTLHMTLTRPDLRSPEELPPTNHTKVNNQPLERPELVAECHPVSIWGTLPTEESKMKRFLRKLKLK